MVAAGITTFSFVDLLQKRELAFILVLRRQATDLMALEVKMQKLPPVGPRSRGRVHSILRIEVRAEFWYNPRVIIQTCYIRSHKAFLRSSTA